LVPPKAGLFILIQRIMTDKKQIIFKSPDISKLREVIIDHRTKIYIAPGADIEEARIRYLYRNSTKRVK
jgi:hypothetical protein